MNRFRHTKCSKRVVLEKVKEVIESNPTLILKNLKKFKRFDPCKRKNVLVSNVKV